MTLQELYTEGVNTLEAAGTADAAIDAREFLLEAFSMDLTSYLLKRTRKLPDDQASRRSAEYYRDMLGKRCQRIPLQQILARAEFMGLEFLIDSEVLIPRQDTETLVEQVLADCREESWRTDKAGFGEQKKYTQEKRKREAYLAPKRGIPRISDQGEEAMEKGKSLLDLCTGSGCIAISLGVRGDFAKITATDISEEALKIARKNAERYVPGRLNFYQGDLFDALPGSGEKYDVITANPPYIPTAVIAGLEPEVKTYEPWLALDGHEDGLYFYRRILSEADNYLAPGGRIYLEIGFDQAEAVAGIAAEAEYRQIRLCQDLAGNDRVVVLAR